MLTGALRLLSRLQWAEVRQSYRSAAAAVSVCADIEPNRAGTEAQRTDQVGSDLVRVHPNHVHAAD